MFHSIERAYRFYLGQGGFWGKVPGEIGVAVVMKVWVMWGEGMTAREVVQLMHRC